MKRVMKSLVVLFTVMALSGLMFGSVIAGGLDPIEVNKNNFDNPTVIDNMYWPLVPGTTFLYEAEEDDELIVNEFTVTNKTKKVCGIRTRVIYDVEWEVDEDGEEVLLEETFDWYAQDNFGNIWYFGEETYEYIYDEETGDLIEISPEGSWEACVDGAEPGIVMLAEPIQGLSYRQEYYEGEAEDMGKVLRLNATVSVTLDTGEELELEGVLVTKEWTVLEPGSVEHKYYAPRIGLVLVQELKEGTVWVELVAIIAP